MARSPLTRARPLLLALLGVAASGIAPLPSRAQTASAGVSVAQALEQGERGRIEPAQWLISEASPPVQAALRAKVGAATNDLAAVRRAAQAYVRTGDTDPILAGSVWSSLAGVAFAQDDYALAADAAQRWIAAIPPDKADDRDAANNLLGLARLLAPKKPQRVVRYAPVAVATTRDAADLVRGDLLIGTQTASAILDSGANLSVVSATFAERLGLNILSGDAGVASVTHAALPVRVAVAPQIIFAGVTLSNVVFLVLPDEQLRVPLPNYRIDVILGYPVFRALEKITFRPGQLIPSRAPHRPTGATLHYSGSNLLVEGSFNESSAWLHLDTGARLTALSALFAQAHPDLVEGLPRGTRQLSGAGGGATDQQVAQWTNVHLDVGGEKASLPLVKINLERGVATGGMFEGNLGQDYLSRFPGYSLDLRNGRLILEAGLGIADKPAS